MNRVHFVIQSRGLRAAETTDELALEMGEVYGTELLNRIYVSTLFGMRGQLAHSGTARKKTKSEHSAISRKSARFASRQHDDAA